jgi:hypothetical protein
VKHWRRSGTRARAEPCAPPTNVALAPQVGTNVTLTWDDPVPAPNFLGTEISIAGGPWAEWVTLIPGGSGLLVADAGFDPTEVTVQVRIRVTDPCTSDWVPSNIIGP